MYEKEGYVAEDISAIITLIIGVGVCALVLIFVGALGGSVYTQVEGQILDYNQEVNATVFLIHPDGITNANVSRSIQNAITSSFDAIETTGNYLPIVVLAVIISIVLVLVTGMGGGGRSAYYGGAL